MKPIGPLMREHRLIERMISLLKAEIDQINTSGKVNTGFLMVAIDFIRTYADRTHHGKEEDILFRDLARKSLSPEHAGIMHELLEEHATARKIVARLANARDSYIKGASQSHKDIVNCLQELVVLYPPHIEKEDKHFFYPCLEYLSKQEQDAMLHEFWEFDKKLIHEKYQRTVEDIEQRKIS
ncbi:MAG: hemerythrin domain-containing protein [Dehalococcoidia bacterium]|nr:hemerythrin domain-containing protein [Dehalococcoidia bacterium]MDD5647587.1 hemerythrin domain-containing protein [Dehalococcoidia bacterium]